MARKNDEPGAQPDGQPDGRKADGPGGRPTGQSDRGPYNCRVGLRADVAHRLRTVAALKRKTPCELADEALFAYLKSWRLPSQAGGAAAGGAADAESAPA